MTGLFVYMMLAPLWAPAPPAASGLTAAPDWAEQGRVLVEVKANTKKNLRDAIAAYETALKDETMAKKQRVWVLNDMSRAHLRIADLLKGNDIRIAEYEQGQTRAQQAQKLDPKNADAMFWEAANAACIGREKGILNAAAGVGALKDKLRAALKHNPNHHYARETLAKVYHTLPGLMGGDDDEAEAQFKEILRRDPNFTPAKVSYAQFLIDDDRPREAKKLLVEVRDTKKSSVPHDWRKFNRGAAIRMLAKIDR